MNIIEIFWSGVFLLGTSQYSAVCKEQYSVAEDGKDSYESIQHIGLAKAEQLFAENCSCYLQETERENPQQICCMPKQVGLKAS